MRVKIETLSGSRTMSLEQALQPSTDYGSGGIAEQAGYKADAACEAVGRTLATLVEQKVLTLEKAAECAGVYSNMELMK